MKNISKIKKMADPLTRNFDIKYFRYLKLYPDKSRILLTNLPDSLRFIYEEGHYKKMWFEGEFPVYLGSGFNLWKEADHMDKTDFEKEINLNLGLHNGITYVNQCLNYWELFTFDGISQQIHQLERKLLMHFIIYFKEQAQELLSDGEKEKIYLPEYSDLIKSDNVYAEKIADFLNKTTINRYYLSEKYRDIYLTPKEVNCIYWLIQGKTAEEIAIIEGNSKKTIERHIENVKLKLNCTKLVQVLTIVISSGILDSLLLKSTIR